MLMTSETKNRSISAQCKPPGKTSSRNLEIYSYNGFDWNTVLSPLLESDDAIFHIRKGTLQEVKAETTSPQKSLLL